MDDWSGYRIHEQLDKLKGDKLLKEYIVSTVYSMAMDFIITNLRINCKL